MRVVRSGLEPSDLGRRQRGAASPPRTQGESQTPPTRRRRANENRPFLHRAPVFACAVSVIITLLGAITLPTLAVDQYPRIAPPTVTVSATYPGASAEVMAGDVAAPLEQQINGVDDMLYMSSQSIGEGRVNITVTFKLGTDVDIAQVKVQNRVQTALPQLPQEVQDLGVTVRKGAGDTLLIVHMTATDPAMDRKFLANYASLQVRERLLRVAGVGDVGVNAARDYAMRIWIDPDKAAARNLTVQEIVDALRTNNAQVAAGAVGAPPFTDNPASSQLIIETAAKLFTPDEFANVIIKRDDQGRVTRVSDIGRVELGAQNLRHQCFQKQRARCRAQCQPGAGQQRPRSRGSGPANDA